VAYIENLDVKIRENYRVKNQPKSDSVIGSLNLMHVNSDDIHKILDMLESLHEDLPITLEVSFTTSN
jgi:hypothetical protein|tara:strand:- start:208 stop:408 length:201 start_codon:yes stop_codon:yes gene_type:complete